MLFKFERIEGGIGFPPWIPSPVSMRRKYRDTMERHPVIPSIIPCIDLRPVSRPCEP
nr:hypothetical protein [Candidatus Sigynarchaeota archaeon]